MKNEGPTRIGNSRESLSCHFRHMSDFFRVSCSEIINLQNHKKETALYLAVSDQRLAVVEVFLGLGADRTIKFNGQTALDLAIQMEAEHKYRSAAEIVKLLSIVNTTT
uniref:Uncharacterized protein n=2 Tax=Spongospora subterranea TaxID=70186 RepID=A0A0H5QY79_9EUKA|eukprot:CRZ06943.1 hypothetical protein [Spongospora subterranea]